DLRVRLARQYGQERRRRRRLLRPLAGLSGVTQSDGRLVAQTDGWPEKRAPVALPDDRRSRCSALALRWAPGLVVVEEEVAVDGGSVAVEHGGEQFVAVGHHAAVIAGRMLGDGDLGIRRDQVGVAGGLQEVVQTGEHLVARRVLEEQTSTEAAANRLEIARIQAV